jgi:hypothetical protein
MIKQESYSRVWRRYKRNVMILWVLFLGFIPIGYFVIKPLMEHYQSDMPMTIFILAWLILLSYSCVVVGYFRCPRCGNLFFGKWTFWGMVGFYTNKCIHCGLQKYSSEDSAI